MAIGCKKCGKCCRCVSIEFGGEVSPGYLIWLGLHGAILKDNVIAFPVKCRALNSNNKCVLYGSTARPPECAKYPNKTIKKIVSGCRFFED